MMQICKKTVFMKILCVLLISALSLSFCACGKTDDGKSSGELSAEEKLKLAEKAVGGAFAELEQMIGPASEERSAARCGTSGEDHEYSYDGFSVFTYSEGDSEVVEEVEIAK